MLSDFLQQNLNSELSNSILSQLQEQLSAGEQLVEGLSQLRNHNKLDQIERKMCEVEKFNQIKEDLLKSLLKMDDHVVDQLASIYANQNTLIAYLLHLQKKNICVLMKESIKQIFFSTSHITKHDQETRILQKYEDSLRAVRSKVKEGGQVTRRQLEMVKKEETQFVSILQEFEDKVGIFNMKIDSLFNKLQIFSSGIRTQFTNLLGLNHFQSSTPPQNETPLIKLNHSYQQQNNQFPPHEEIVETSAWTHQNKHIKYSKQYHDENGYQRRSTAPTRFATKELIEYKE